MKLTIRAMLIGLVLFAASHAKAQISSTGKLFFLSFMEMEARTGGYPDSLLVYVTSEVNTTVTVDNPRIPSTSYNVSITAGKVNRISLDPGFYYPQGYEKPASDIESKRSIRIAAKDPINVYTLNLELNRSDGTFVLPYESIPKAPEFYIASFTPTQYTGGKYMPSEFVIVGMDNNVQVEITPTAKTAGGHAAGTAFTVTLAKGQVYQVQSDPADGNTSNPPTSTGDMTGTRVRVINGCGKINVFSGMKSVKILPTAACGVAVDHLYTQVFPTSNLGTKHVVMPFMTNTKGYIFRVIATKANTKVYVDGTYIGSTLGAGKTYFADVTTAVAKCVTADSPIYVVQYMRNGQCAGTTGSYGDPAILIMPDFNQKILKTVVGTATTNNMNKHYINVLVKTSAKGSVKLNGTPISASSFTDVACAGHSYVQVNVANPSTNTVECDSGLIVVVYGMGQYESYSYCAGALFENLDYDFTYTRNSKCPNVPVSLTAVTTNKNVKKFLWNFGDGFQDTGKTVLHSFKKTGSFYVVMKAIVPAACGGNDTITRSKIVTVSAGPLYNMPDTLFQCTNNLSVGFTAPVNTKYLYAWQDSSRKNTYTATSPGKVWLRIRDTATNCVLYDSTLVQQFNPLKVIISHDTINECRHSNFFSFSDSTQYKSDAFKSGKWVLKRFGYFDSTSTLPRFRLHFDTTANYKLDYQVLSKNGCRDTGHTTITVVNEPIAKIWTLKPQYCQKEMSKFIDSSSGPGGISTGYWDFGDGNKATGLTVLHSFVTYNSFKVTLITESTHKCRDTVDSMIVINPLPVMAMGVTTNQVCKKNNSFTFADNSTIPSGTMSNSWKYLNKTGTAVSSLPNIKFPDTGTYTVRLFNTSNNGCTDSIKKTVYVAPEPVAGILLQDSQKCEKVNYFSLTDNSTVSKGSVAGYKWTFSDGYTSTAKTVVKKSFTSYGTYNVKLVVNTTTYNCKDSVTRSLVVFASPKAPFSVVDSVLCEKNNSFSFTPKATFNVSGVTANYNWDFGDASSSAIATPTHSYAGVGSYLVTFIINTSQNCADTAKRVMKVVGTPVASFTSSKDSACVGTYKFDFNNTTSFGTPVYHWDLGDGSKATSTNVLQKAYASAGSYKVKLVVSSSNSSCADSVTKTVVLMPVPTASFTINNPTQCFANQSFVFGNTSSANGAWGLAYNWVFTPGSSFNTQTIGNQTMPDTGNYKVDLTVTSAFGCTNTYTQNIYVAESPSVVITAKDDCVGVNIPFTATGKINSGSIVSYAWTFGDGGNSATQNPSHAYAASGSYNATCVVTSNKGCTATGGPLAVNVFARPKADFISEQLVSRGMETDHKITFTGSGASAYLWSFYDGSQDNSAGPLFKTFTDTGHKALKLWVVNTDGCADSITHYLYLKPELQMWIPGSFTPNHDGLNETFGPSTIFGLTKFKMQIYDRWGEKLFESQDPKMPWDGRDLKGDDVPEGVYAYQISFRYIDGKIFVYQGTITLMRQ